MRNIAIDKTVIMKNMTKNYGIIFPLKRTKTFIFVYIKGL